jgi:hypothetical protein
MRLMDVMTSYLYSDLDSEIYMKIPDGLYIPGNGLETHTR